MNPLNIEKELAALPPLTDFPAALKWLDLSRRIHGQVTKPMIEDCWCCTCNAQRMRARLNETLPVETGA